MSSLHSTSHPGEPGIRLPALAGYAAGVASAMVGVAGYAHLVTPPMGANPTVLMMVSPLLGLAGMALDSLFSRRDMASRGVAAYQAATQFTPGFARTGVTPSAAAPVTVAAPVVPKPVTMASLPARPAPVAAPVVPPVAPPVAAASAAPIVLTFESLRDLPTLIQSRVMFHIASVAALAESDGARKAGDGNQYRVRMDGPRYDMRLA
jgi:hypothetical protein